MPDFSKNKSISPLRVSLKPTVTDSLMAEHNTILPQAQQQKHTILALAFKGKICD